jgi:hypothetical protein
MEQGKRMETTVTTTGDGTSYLTQPEANMKLGATPYGVATKKSAVGDRC